MVVQTVNLSQKITAVRFPMAHTLQDILKQPTKSVRKAMLFVSLGPVSIDKISLFLNFV